MHVSLTQNKNNSLMLYLHFSYKQALAQFI